MTEEKPAKQNNIDFSNFTWPVILIFSGLTLLLNNLGIIDWEVWNIIIRFWPLLLILAGFQYLIGKSWIGNFLSFLITFAVISLVFLFSISQVKPQFDQYIRKNFRLWENVMKIIPERNLRRPMFHCHPLDENCFRFYNY